MNAFRNTLYVMLKRPALLALMGLVTFAVCILVYFNPIFNLLVGMGAISGSSIFENIIYVIQFVSKPSILIKILVGIFALSVVVAILMGLIFSGFFYMTNITLYRKKASARDFFTGVRRYFVRLSIMFLIVINIIVAFVIAMLIASVPAIIITNSWMKNSHNVLAAMLFINIVTVGIIFIGFMFVRIYSLFWFPAVYNEQKNPYRTMKSMIDNCFWRIVLRFMAFDLVYILVQGSIVAVNVSTDSSDNVVTNTVLFILSWIFNTIFFTLFNTYLFSVYKACKSKASK